MTNITLPIDTFRKLGETSMDFCEFMIQHQDTNDGHLEGMKILCVYYKLSFWVQL